ncbi:choline O-acetyltransferase-like isoform X3 [Centruroides sculpturatus]|uniref:choline O-acetyltransferase-like isoform X3 n=1 Tax=Centruroides sculpturatus TaxID=218467 RepID=UPI000C6E9386|nr:choline O-acetyltransferase-like isoform X3 [Centruroides sculpturatus]
MNVLNVLCDFKDLPKPPVPKLGLTIERYLNGIKRIIPGEQYAVTEKLAREFKDSEEGNTLQYLIKEYAEETDNYVTEFWLSDMYLRSPLPLPINCNPFFMLPKQSFKTDLERYSYIAQFIIFSLLQKIKLDREEVEQDIVYTHGKGYPLSMDTAYKLYSGYRRPDIEDKQIFAKSSNHIIVICNNQIFRLQFEDSSVYPSEEALCKILTKIEEESVKEPIYPPVGIITTASRLDCSNFRQILSEDIINQESIQKIEECLYILCMDNSLRDILKSAKDSNERKEIMARHIFHGSKIEHSSGNRWFEKCLQFIITKNGVNGVCMEPSILDESVLLQFLQEFMLFLKINRPRRRIMNSMYLEKLKWIIHPKEVLEIESAGYKINQLVSELDLKIMKFTKYGKEFIKRRNLNPDVYIEICIQMAYFRLYKTLTSTYQAASLRKFRYGRFDNIRVSSEDLMNFFEIFYDETVKKEEKVKLFLKVIEKQIEMYIYTINGEGPDNHLLCLKEFSHNKRQYDPALFRDKSYQEYLNFCLQIKQINSKYNIIVGYGPMTRDGYSCCFNLQEHQIIFTLTSFNTFEKTDLQSFAQHLTSSLIEIGEFCEKNLRKLTINTKEKSLRKLKRE